MVCAFVHSCILLPFPRIFLIESFFLFHAAPSSFSSALVFIFLSPFLSFLKNIANLLFCSIEWRTLPSSLMVFKSVSSRGSNAWRWTTWTVLPPSTSFHLGISSRTPFLERGLKALLLERLATSGSSSKHLRVPLSRLLKVPEKSWPRYLYFLSFFLNSRLTVLFCS